MRNQKPFKSTRSIDLTMTRQTDTEHWETGYFKHRVTRHRWEQSGAGLTLMSTGDTQGVTGENNQEIRHTRETNDRHENTGKRDQTIYREENMTRRTEKHPHLDIET